MTNPSPRLGLLLVAVVAVAALATPARAQVVSCQPTVQDVFGPSPGLPGTVEAAVRHDDGTGDALYVAGLLTGNSSGVLSRVHRRDPDGWVGLGDNLFFNEVFALASFDDGSGPALFAAGDFTEIGGVTTSGIARWDGANWSPVGGGLSGSPLVVRALHVHDDGTGPALYAGGRFTDAGGLFVGGLARWDGTSWSAPPAFPGFADVHALVTHDDGSGSPPALVATGELYDDDSIDPLGPLRLEGGSWVILDREFGGTIRALAVEDDGLGGERLLAGGDFADIDGTPVAHLATWDGTSWTEVGGGTDGPVFALAVHDDGGGPALHVGGDFSMAGGLPVPLLAAWDGASWSAVGPPFGWSSALTLDVRVLLDTDLGAGPELVAAGTFNDIGALPARNIASWRGGSWDIFGTGLDHVVHALACYDDGTGEALYVGGTFNGADGLTLDGIARWDAGGWETVGAGTLEDVKALLVRDDGGSATLLAAGEVPGGAPDVTVASWTGSVWQPVGPPLTTAGDVNALVSHDDGSGAGAQLYAGGSVPGKLLRFDGSSWTVPGGSTMFGNVLDMAVYDEGQGPVLFVAGNLNQIDGVPYGFIARWDGSGWSDVGGGLNSGVNALEVYDDGTGAGPRLYVGGSFTEAGGAPAAHIACWDGQVWSPLGLGTDSTVTALGVHDDGSGVGPSLFVCGGFDTAGGAPAQSSARWSAFGWQPVGWPGIQADDLQTFDDGSGAALYFGGRFLGTVQGTSDSYLTRYGGCNPPVWDDLGGGSPGVLGVPHLLVEGNLLEGSLFRQTLTDAAPSAFALEWLSFTSTPWNVLGGTLHANPPSVQRLVVTNFAGSHSLIFDWPPGIPAGLDLYLQFLVEDTSVPAQITLSNGVTRTTP